MRFRTIKTHGAAAQCTSARKQTRVASLQLQQQLRLRGQRQRQRQQRQSHSDVNARWPFADKRACVCTAAQSRRTLHIRVKSECVLRARAAVLCARRIDCGNARHDMQTQRARVALLLPRCVACASATFPRLLASVCTRFSARIAITLPVACALAHTDNS